MEGPRKPLSDSQTGARPSRALWTAPEAEGTPASPVGPSEATTLDRLRRSRAWNNLGDLKRDLIDLWIGKRNALTKEVMTGIEARRREAAQ